MMKSNETSLADTKLLAEIRDLRFWSPLKALAATATGVATIGLAVWGLLAESGPAQERLRIEQDRLQLEQDQLTALREDVTQRARDFASAFHAVFAEPSGLTMTCHKMRSGLPALIAIDDEIRFPVLLEPAGDYLLPVAHLKHDDIGGVDDLEAIAAIPRPNCDDSRYLIFTSHRRFDEAEETRAVRFGLLIPGSGASPALFDVERFSLRRGILEYLRENQEDLFSIGVAGEDEFVIDGLRWDQRHEGDPQYALEIEAAVATTGAFFVGLKYPLKDGMSVLLRYDLDEMLTASEGPHPVDHVLLDLGGLGISAMTFDQGHVWVAANPSASGAYAQSVLYRFRVDEEGWHEVDSQSLARPGAKAEGLARLGDRLWVAFDGDVGVIEAPTGLRLP